MSHYDVYANPSKGAATGILNVVVIQRDMLDALATRLHALAHYAAPLPAKLLRRPIDNVAAQAAALVSAIDVVLSGV